MDVVASCAILYLTIIFIFATLPSPHQDWALPLLVSKTSRTLSLPLNDPGECCPDAWDVHPSIPWHPTLYTLIHNTCPHPPKHIPSYRTYDCMLYQYPPYQCSPSMPPILPFPQHLHTCTSLHLHICTFAHLDNTSTQACGDSGQGRGPSRFHH